MNGDGKQPLEPGKPDPARLAGGWAAGNLTPEERRELLEGALHDQQLFDELMEEEPLREALENPEVREELIAALQPAQPAWKKIFRPWAWMPAAAAAGALAGFMMWMVRSTSDMRSKEEMAQNRTQAPMAAYSIQPRMDEVPLSPIEPSRIKIVPRTGKDAGARASQTPPGAVPAGQAGGEVSERKIMAPEAAQREEPPRAALAVVEPQVVLNAVEPAAAAAASAGPMPVALAYRDAGGEWRVLQGDGEIPRNVPVRLTVTAPGSGTVVVQERSRHTAVVSAGQTASFELPPFEAGEYDIWIAIAPAGAPPPAQDAFQAPAASGLSSAERRKAAAVSARDVQRAEPAAPAAEMQKGRPDAAAPPKVIRIRVK
jgi:hypothetical protein